MINYASIIERIQALLAEGTEQSITYAALEARLALEKVCYDRLRQAHDYISHAQLRRWQPRDVINTLMSDGNYPRLFLRCDAGQACTVFRMVLKGEVPGLSRAVSTTVRMAASPSAAHIAR